MSKLKMDKDPWEDVPSEFKDAIYASDVVEIKKRIAEVALHACENAKNKKEDQALAEKRVEYMEAGAQYKETAKACKKQIEFCRMVLDNKGAV